MVFRGLANAPRCNTDGYQPGAASLAPSLTALDERGPRRQDVIAVTGSLLGGIRMIVRPATIEEFARNATPPSPLLAGDGREDRLRPTIPEMVVGPVEGGLLAMVVALLRRPHLNLEIGTLTGHSERMTPTNGPSASGRYKPASSDLGLDNSRTRCPVPSP